MYLPSPYYGDIVQQYTTHPLNPIPTPRGRGRAHSVSVPVPY